MSATISRIYRRPSPHADLLAARGVTVRYVGIDAPSDSQSIIGELHHEAFARVMITEPGELRLAATILILCAGPNRDRTPLMQDEEEANSARTAPPRRRQLTLTSTFRPVVLGWGDVEQAGSLCLAML